MEMLPGISTSLISNKDKIMEVHTTFWFQTKSITTNAKYYPDNIRIMFVLQVPFHLMAYQQVKSTVLLCKVA
jgi:hypothetical protein